MRLLKNSRLMGDRRDRRDDSGSAFWPSATEVDVATVERGPMQVTIDEEGETRVRERFVVSAPVWDGSSASSSSQAIGWCAARPWWPV